MGLLWRAQSIGSFSLLALCLLLESLGHMTVPFASGVQSRGSVKGSLKGMKVRIEQMI